MNLAAGLGDGHDLFGGLSKLAQDSRCCILHGDNETSIILTKNAESQARTKHIDVQHLYIRKLVADGELVVKWVCSANMLADGFYESVDS